MRRSDIAATIIAYLALAGCASTTQTGSGADFVNARPEWAAQVSAEARPGGTGPASVDRAVFEAARAEPLLRFPARFGLARVQRGQLTSIPPEEAEAWLAVIKDAGPLYGEFLPISPLIAEIGNAFVGSSGSRGVVDRVRIGAARQQVDAVLIYEVLGQATDRATPLSVLDLTIVGAFLLPTRLVAGQAVASALLVDVRNGYPYGTATAQGDARGLWSNSGSTGRSQSLREDAEVEAVRKLTREVGAMVARLKTELEARPAARAAPTASPPRRS